MDGEWLLVDCFDGDCWCVGRSADGGVGLGCLYGGGGCGVVDAAGGDRTVFGALCQTADDVRVFKKFKLFMTAGVGM